MTATAGRRSGPPRRVSVRLRLTALIAVLVVGVGGTLVGASYWLLAVHLPRTLLSAGFGSTDTGGVEGADGAVEPDGVVLADASPVEGVMVDSAAPDGTATAIPVGEVQGLVSAAVTDFSLDYQGAIARRFTTWSVALLAALTLAAVAVGTVVSGRALRPVHTLTGTARRLGDRSLDERIAVSGPHDELRELAETFNAMLDRIESAFSRERRLMANISHELRTPLANQRTAIEVGLEDPDADREQLRALAETALAQNRRAERLIGQLLLLARAERCAPGEGDAPLDLRDVVRAAAAAAAAAEPGGPDVAVEICTAPAPVAADPLLLERLAGNLLENALRHNGSDGFVRVVVDTDPGTGAALLEVENSGPVVPVDDVPGLFEPLRRGGSSGDRVRSDRGAGLGLSIVAAIAERHGAAVRAVARETGGLRVRVVFPAVTDGPTDRPTDG